jgi:hypothetical protein
MRTNQLALITTSTRFGTDSFGPDACLETAIGSVIVDTRAVAAHAEEQFHIDKKTRQIGLSGIAAARAALRAHSHQEAA